MCLPLEISYGLRKHAIQRVIPIEWYQDKHPSTLISCISHLHQSLTGDQGASGQSRPRWKCHWTCIYNIHKHLGVQTRNGASLPCWGACEPLRARLQPPQYKHPTCQTAVSGSDQLMSTLRTHTSRQSPGPTTDTHVSNSQPQSATVSKWNSQQQTMKHSRNVHQPRLKVISNHSTRRKLTKANAVTEACNHWQPAPSIENWKIMLQKSFTAQMPLSMTKSQ